MLLRIISTSISVIILIGASLIPYIGLKRRDLRGSGLLCSSSNLLPIFTCFSCGVFMSTCFLGLMPHLQANEQHIKSELNKTNPSQYEKYSLFLDSNLLIITGFLIIVLIEQSVVFCLPADSNSSSSKNRNSSSSRRSNNSVAETRKILELIRNHKNKTHCVSQTILLFNEPNHFTFTYCLTFL